MTGIRLIQIFLIPCHPGLYSVPGCSLHNGTNRHLLGLKRNSGVIRRIWMLKSIFWRTVCIFLDRNFPFFVSKLLFSQNFYCKLPPKWGNFYVPQQIPIWRRKQPYFWRRKNARYSGDFFSNAYLLMEKSESESTTFPFLNSTQK